jgi:hypothetical protein
MDLATREHGYGMIRVGVYDFRPQWGPLRRLGRVTTLSRPSAVSYGTRRLARCGSRRTRRPFLT